jgi:hypothetical protein
LIGAALAIWSSNAHAQLVDETQVYPSVAGGTIGKSLEEQVGDGQGSIWTEGSSMYLINRDPARSIRRGRQIFQRKFTTDFKRHDLGEAFHEREYDGTYQREFLTEALWGVGTTAPYGHDGRSISLEEVILLHGGETQASRDAYARLGESERRSIHEFLQTLVLFPPDDTASNLNPGSGEGHIQDPATHGTINLGALFQIEYEGAE